MLAQLGAGVSASIEMERSYCETLADRAAEALKQHDALTGDPGAETDDEAAVTLITNVRHLCERQGWDFNRLVRQSRDLYAVDCHGEPAVVLAPVTICGDEE